MEFSDIALAKFLQVAPELGSLILSFSELPDESEGDIKTGVFSLRVGSGVAFIPVVSKGENVFPIDSIFLDEESQFRPLTKGTINSIMNSVQMSPGKVKKMPTNIDRNPSVYNMINPPRTGKFTYASSSRLVEFLAVLPNNIKQATFEKISSEKTVYDNLDRLFGLKTIFEVLQPTQHTLHGTDGSTSVPTSVVTGPRQVQVAFTEAMADDLVNRGFAIVGAPEFSRVAISFQPFNNEGTYKEVSNSVDGGQDHNIVLKSGASREAFLPNSHELNPVRGQTFALFSNGDYANADKYVTSGDAVDRQTVLKTVFEISPPKLLKELNREEEFILFSNSGEYLGPFRSWTVVQNELGTEIDISGLGGVKKIRGYRNYTQEVNRIGDTLYVPSNVIVLSLGANLSGDIEPSTHDASRKKELHTSQFLGAELNLRYDGVEYSGNGRVLGDMPAALKHLVEQESLEPDVAQKFLKQASVEKSVKIFMSKKASSDFNPGDIPQFGNTAGTPAGDVSVGGNFMPAVQEANRLGDGQVMEATIISQLLQVPDLFEYIEEYVPELSDTVDKLGRILFLTRAKLNQLSENLDPDSVFALISQIKNVYRTLGDTVEKLKENAAASKGFVPDTQAKQTNGS